MTNEEKQLLLVDLSARLPYGVKGFVTVHITTSENSTFDRVVDGKLYDRFANLQNSWYDNIPSIKPYLRPISSMTEEEKEEYCALQDKFLQSSQYPVTDAYEIFDWLNKKMFDYRDLIPMGLAIEAPNECMERRAGNGNEVI